MAEFPKLGMEYQDVSNRLKKYKSIKKHNNKNLRDSLVRQAILHEGEGAGHELVKEHFSEASSSKKRYSGAYNRSHGIGECKIKGREKYVYKEDGTVEKVGSGC